MAVMAAVVEVVVNASPEAAVAVLLPAAAAAVVLPATAKGLPAVAVAEALPAAVALPAVAVSLVVALPAVEVGGGIIDGPQWPLVHFLPSAVSKLIHQTSCGQLTVALDPILSWQSNLGFWPYKSNSGQTEHFNASLRGNQLQFLHQGYESRALVMSLC